MQIEIVVSQILEAGKAMDLITFSRLLHRSP